VSCRILPELGASLREFCENEVREEWVRRFSHAILLIFLILHLLSSSRYL
jgi:hypothetical protein